MKITLKLAAACIAAISTANAATLTAAEASAQLMNASIAADGFALPITDYSHAGYSYGECWNAGGDSNCATATTIHPALDMNTANDCGRKVYAVADGIVRFSDLGGAEWGGVIALHHRYVTQSAPGPYVTKEVVSISGHVAPLDTTVSGKIVKKGDHIAFIGRGKEGCASINFPGVADPGKWAVTWNSHLHFEMRTNLQMAPTAWNNMATLNEAVRGTTCYNQLRTSSSCRLKALAAAGFVDPIAFVNANPISAIGSLLDHCINRYALYFGAKSWPNLLVDGFFIQPTTGTVYPVTAIAATATLQPPAQVYYYWNGWGSLSAASCNL